MMDKTVEYYNTLKERAGYKIFEKVENYMNVVPLSDCTRDEGIDSIISMFHNSDATFEEIKTTKSVEYIKRYRQLLLMESEFILELSDNTAEIFTKYIRTEKAHNNYTLINAYFNGFRVGSKITQELDDIYKEIQKQNKVKE